MDTFINDIANEISRESNIMTTYGKYYELGYAVGSVNFLQILKIAIDDSDTYEKILEQMLSGEKVNNYTKRIYEEFVKETNNEI